MKSKKRDNKLTTINPMPEELEEALQKEMCMWLGIKVKIKKVKEDNDNSI